MNRGYNEAQTQQQKYLHCYNIVNVFGAPSLNSLNSLDSQLFKEFRVINFEF